MKSSERQTLSYTQDLKVKELIPIKILSFLQTAGDMALFPFLTLHLKSLGMSLTEIGIQFAISPIATLIGTPLFGLLADRIGNFKRMLSISLIICAVLGYCLSLIPAVKTYSECSAETDFITLSCPHNNNKFNVSINNLIINLPNCIEKSIATNKRVKKKNLNNKQTSIININECRVECDNDVVCLHNTTTNNNSDHLCVNHAIISVNANVIESFQQSLNVSLISIISNQTLYDNFTCKQTDVCTIRCPVIANKFANYTEKKIVDQNSRKFTFWMYMFVRIILFVVIVSEISLLKAAVLTIVGKCNSEYGYQRFWSSIAMVIVPPLTGLLMDYERSNDRNTFAVCFHIYASFKILMAIVSLCMNLDVKPPSLDVWRKVGNLIKNSEVAILLLFVTFIGSAWGFIETFIVWYIEELGGSRSFIGVSIALGAASGLPVSIFAGSIERKFGHIPVLCFGLIVYAIRMIGYSFTDNFYYILIYESMEGITTSLVIITITTYSTILANRTNLIATMQATWAALHFSVGRAVGSGIGGYLMDKFGSKNTYRIYSGFCIIAAVLYLIIYLFWLRDNEKRRQTDLVEENEQKNVTALQLSNQKQKNKGLENPSFIKSE